MHGLSFRTRRRTGHFKPRLCPSSPFLSSLSGTSLMNHGPDPEFLKGVDWHTLVGLLEGSVRAEERVYSSTDSDSLNECHWTDYSPSRLQTFGQIKWGSEYEKGVLVIWIDRVLIFISWHNFFKNQSGSTFVGLKRMDGTGRLQYESKVLSTIRHSTPFLIP